MPNSVASFNLLLESYGAVCQGKPVIWMHSMTRAGVACLAVTLAAPLLPSMGAAVDLGPQGVVRQFCQADGHGQRVSIPGWTALAPLLTWVYEPAWDTVALITGYSVGSPQPAGEHMFAVEVNYSVVGLLSPLGLNPEAHAEVVTYQVQPDEQGSWHILGPPPPPHLFVSRVDIDTMRRSLSNGSANFLANSVFVWQMFQSAGWNVPFESTTDLLSGAAYRVVDNANPGDLVVYLRDGAPYHVGLLEAHDQVVSSTLNAGITRTPVDAFPGEVRYLRLGQADFLPAATPAEPSPADTSVIRPTPKVAKNRPTATVKAAKKNGTRTPPSKRKKKAKPAAHKGVQAKQQSPPRRPRPTPGLPTVPP